jgi:hypothetical protein
LMPHCSPRRTRSLRQAWASCRRNEGLVCNLWTLLCIKKIMMTKEAPKISNDLLDRPHG